MKHITFALFIAVGLVIPSTSHAEIVSDQIKASFDRDLNRKPTQGNRIATGNEDSVQHLINVALRTDYDQVVASFDRDLYRMPTQGVRVTGVGNDFFQKQVNSMLRGKTNTIIASFERDMGVNLS